MGEHKAAKPSFEQLLECLYGCVIEPARFEEFAAGLRRTFDSHLVALHNDDLSHVHNIRQHYADEPVEAPTPDGDDANVNQYMVRGATEFMRTGVLDSSPLFASGELERTAFYREILQPVDVLHSMGLYLGSDAPGTLTGISISRDKSRSAFDSGDLSLGHRLLPHLQNVYAIQQRLQQLESLVCGMDTLSSAVWLLDADGAIAHGNIHAHETVATRGSVIRQLGQQLCVAWPADKLPFRAGIEAATRLEDRQRSDVLLHDANGQACAICSIHPLHAPAVSGWMVRGQTTAMVFLRKFTSCAETTAERLRHLFDLTVAEARLAEALLRHRSLAGCVQSMGKSRETLRTQLKALFAKTGTHHQSELLQRLQSAVG